MTIALTSVERMTLGLVASRGDTGLGTYSRDPAYHPAIEYGTSWYEGLESLQRFGLVRYSYPKGQVTGRFYATEEGLERANARGWAETRYAPDCVGCVSLMCVCSYKMGCLVAEDPMRPEGLTYHPVGCHGTHD